MLIPLHSLRTCQLPTASAAVNQHDPSEACTYHDGHILTSTMAIKEWSGDTNSYNSCTLMCHFHCLDCDTTDMQGASSISHPGKAEPATCTEHSPKHITRLPTRGGSNLQLCAESRAGAMEAHFLSPQPGVHVSCGLQEHELSAQFCQGLPAESHPPDWTLPQPRTCVVPPLPPLLLLHCWCLAGLRRHCCRHVWSPDQLCAAQKALLICVEIWHHSPPLHQARCLNRCAAQVPWNVCSCLSLCCLLQAQVHQTSAPTVLAVQTPPFLRRVLVTNQWQPAGADLFSFMPASTSHEANGRGSRKSVGADTIRALQFC